MTYKKYNIFRKLFSVVWKDAGQMQFRMGLGVVLVVIGSLSSLLLPWCLKFIVEYFNKPNLPFMLILLLITYGVIWLVSHLIIDLRQIVVCRVFVKGVNKITSEVFQKILDLSMKYHISNTTGNIMSNIERAQISIFLVLYGLMFVVFPMTIEVIIAAGILWYYYGITIAGMLFLIFLSYVLFTWYCIPWVVKFQLEGNRCHQRVSDYITDVLMNIEGIHYQSAQIPVALECKQRLMDRENAVTKEIVRTEMVCVGQSIIAGLGFICMSLMIGVRVMNNQLVISDFILINGYLIQFLVPLGAIGFSLLRDIREGLTRMEGVMDLLSEKEDIVDKSSAKLIKQELVDIIFDNVAFVYPGKKDYILKNISFYLPTGKAMSIVGANGAGKSTIAKLLYRLFEVSKGSITIQNEDIRNIKLLELRKLIGIVPQEVFLLNDTIYSNLLLGLEEKISEDMFKKVTRVTNIEEWVNTLPDKYMTVVGEQGVRLSGGEKKRIGIARALLRNPKILVLDEAMAALDVDTEYQILNHICESFQNLTRIIITHNEKYLSDVDMVIYLESGLIQACGRHDDLLIQNKKYRRIWRK